MTDKDETMRSILRSNFPAANLILCKFHFLQIFKISIKLGIMPSDESLSREYIQKNTLFKIC